MSGATLALAFAPEVDATPDRCAKYHNSPGKWSLFAHLSGVGGARWRLRPHRPLLIGGKVGCWRVAPASPSRGDGSFVVLGGLGEVGEGRRFGLSCPVLCVDTIFRDTATELWG